MKGPFESWDVGLHKVFLGDNASILKKLAPGSVDLAYLDPPFNTSTERSVEWGEEKIRRSFPDKFPSTQEYIRWIEPRIRAVVKALRGGGSLFLHCDYRTSHYLKILLDKVLGEAAFINEIVWKRHNAHSDARQGARHFGRNLDTILYYGKGERSTFKPQYQPYEDSYVSSTYCYVDPDGRRYALGDLTGPGGRLNGNPEFEFLGVHRAWRYSEEKLNELLRSGRVLLTERAQIPRKKRYLDEMPGREVQALWDDIPASLSGERQGYPTQKPLRLLERIILTSTVPGQVVLDPFCGSGTTLVAAELLGRVSIGIDESSSAIGITLERLRSAQESGVARGQIVDKFL